jgi:hypothetical protein
MQDGFFMFLAGDGKGKTRIFVHLLPSVVQWQLKVRGGLWNLSPAEPVQ